MAESKPLGHDDSSGFDFVKEILQGEPTFAINFDRLQKHPKHGYIIFEFLLCEESQPRVTPHTSHPKYYWHKNKQKFISLYRVSKDLPAILYLVNYAKKGTLHEDKIRIIKVHELDDNGIINEEITNTTRAEFAEWFRKLNKECSK